MLSPADSLRALQRLVLLCLTALSLAGCGYGLGADSNSVLAVDTPGALPTIKIKSVESPTLHPWLPYVIRTELRDELAARGIGIWVDSGKADYEISIKVDRFTFRSWLTDSRDKTTLYSAYMSFEAVVYKGDTNQEFWRSGQISYSQSYEQVQERTAAGNLAHELTRRLANSMRKAF